jgi:hypothetical protein
MAFKLKNQKEKRVLFDVEMSGEGEDVKHYKYLIPRIKQYKAMEANTARLKISGTDGKSITGSVIVMDIVERTKTVEGELSLYELLNELDADNSDALIEEVLRLATTSIAKLAAEGADIQEVEA